MRHDVIDKVCELCGAKENLQIHHICYDPEITQILCVPCHQLQHTGHGVGKSTNSPMFDELKEEFIRLHSVMSNRGSASMKLGISNTTAYYWDKRMGGMKYTGATNLMSSVPTLSNTISFRETDDAELVAWLKKREGNPANFSGVNIRNQLRELMQIVKETEQ